jgi:hypothetical protein
MTVTYLQIVVNEKETWINGEEKKEKESKMVRNMVRNQFEWRWKRRI